jgi:hypothetical protein
MRRTRAVLTAVVALALGGCGGDAAPPGVGDGYVLTQRPPIPERVAAGDAVRSIVVFREDRVGARREAVRCGLSTVLFDAAGPSTVVAAGIDAAADCRFYASAPEIDFQRMRWVCAGAVTVTAGPLTQTVGLCPAAGATVRYETTLSGCGTLSSERVAQLGSLDEGIMGDVVTDLAAEARLPTGVTITAPTALTVATWPEAGDLDVRWTSADATSALVRIEPDGDFDPATAPTIVCVARTAGRVTVPQALIAQGNFRTRDVRVRVWSYRDGTTTAEGGKTYRVSGATSSSVVLQGRR